MRGFSLLEIALALAILAIGLAALAVPLASQVQVRRMDEARRQLAEARDAVLGFAAAHGRMPCPATMATRGHEAFAHDGDSANGRCADCAIPGPRARTACATQCTPAPSTG
jgi:prepilin-type N-terminal cleavage/methylation domain-containing protein